MYVCFLLSTQTRAMNKKDRITHENLQILWCKSFISFAVSNYTPSPTVFFNANNKEIYETLLKNVWNFNRETKSTLHFCIFCIHVKWIECNESPWSILHSFLREKKSSFLLLQIHRLSKKKYTSKKRWKRKFNCKIPLYDIKSGPAIMYNSIFAMHLFYSFNKKKCIIFLHFFINAIRWNI